MPDNQAMNDEAVKRAEANRRMRNDGQGNMSTEAREHELFRMKAELRRQRVSVSSDQTTEHSSSHRLLNAKASIRGGGGSSTAFDSHHFSIESLVDEDLPTIEIENAHSLLQAKEYIRNSQHTLSIGDDTASRESMSRDAGDSSSREVVEWVNNSDLPTVASFHLSTTEQGADDEDWEDMEQAIADSLPRRETAPALTAVIVDEEEERQRFALESSQTVARSAVQAEIVDVKKRKIVIGSLVLFAMVVIGSLIAAVTTTSKKRRVTDSPTMAPTVNYVELSEWIEIANNVSFSGTKLTYPPTENANTAEKALAWLIEEEENVPERRAVQRFAFVVLAFSWKNLNTWNVTPGFEECDFEGISCNAENSCVEINMKSLDLAGTIPPEIALLSDMRKIVFIGNEFTGTVPWEPMMKHMEKLEYLDLDVNELTGPLPSPEPGSWPRLEIFWTAWNQFTGTISPGFANWPKLQDLYISDNLLTGTLPTELGAISIMKWFAVDDNLLHGTLPTEIGNWPTIDHFQVEGAGLTGPIPTEIGRWTEIKDFFAYSNNFNGTIPTETGSWPEIIWFRTEFNDMTGPLPSGMSSWTKLTALYLNNNDYTGPLPAGMVNWTVLEEIQINNNRFSGEIPRGLENLDAVSVGHFQVNDFTGSLEDICNVTRKSVVLSADCCEVVCPCCSSCFVDLGAPDQNCSGLSPDD